MHEKGGGGKVSDDKTTETEWLERQSTPQYLKVEEAYKILVGESDRGAVLVGAALLDDLLKMALLHQFADRQCSRDLLIGRYAPLSDLGAKIDAAHALSVVDEVSFKDLHIVRKIRNKFAHTIALSFEDDSVSDQCKNLSGRLGPTNIGDLRNRDRFLTATAVLSGVLSAFIWNISQEAPEGESD
tara:strand:+ start:14781 stop:15335 length:555 start_codon:yes stop_codon:yes gene_type:complete